MKASFPPIPLVILLILAIPQLSSLADVTIGGQVVLGPDKKPAAGAHLGIYPDRRSAILITGGTRVQADEGGHFSVSKSETGTYYIRVLDIPFLRSGKLAKFAAYVIPKEPIEVVVADPGIDPKPVEIVMELGAMVKGRALKQDGIPFRSPIAGIMGTSDGFQGYVDKSGDFTIAGVPTGKDRSVVVLPIQDGYGYNRIVKISGKDLVPGATVDIGEVKFVEKPAEKNFRGTLTEADGEKIKGLFGITLTNPSGSTVFPVGVKDSHFDAAILPGVYRVNHLDPFKDGGGEVLGNVTIKEKVVTEVDLKFAPKPPVVKGGQGAQGSVGQKGKP